MLKHKIQQYRVRVQLLSSSSDKYLASELSERMGCNFNTRRLNVYFQAAIHRAD